MSEEETGYKVTQFRTESDGYILFVLENSEINDGFSVRILKTEFDVMNDKQFGDFIAPLIEARIDEVTIYRSAEKAKQDDDKSKLKIHKEKDVKIKIKKTFKDKETALKPEYPMQP